MSSGSASWRRRLSGAARSVLSALDTMPPAPNQSDVCRLTKPPNDDAYGEGSTTASSRKSVAKPAAPAGDEAAVAGVAP